MKFPVFYFLIIVVNTVFWQRISVVSVYVSCKVKETFRA